MTPHHRSILQYIASLAVLCCGYLLTPNRAIAEPDAMFQPILGEIRDRLPEGMVMRLPSEIEVIGANGVIPLYAKIISSNSSELLLGFYSQPDCQAGFCQIGITLSVSKPDAAARSRISSGSPITLKEGIVGTYIYIDVQGVTRIPYNIIVWEQDGLIYSVRLPSLDRERDKENIIKIAKSMANELPIVAQGKTMQTWQEFVDGGGSRYLGSDYDFPDEFRNGFVYFNTGANQINAYI
jgi:hypothetical protein